MGRGLERSHIERIKGVCPNITIEIAKDEQDQKNRIKDADILLTHMLPKHPELTPDLKWIQFMWEGIDRLDQEMVASNIMITNASGIHDVPVAEHVFQFILIHERKARRYWILQQKSEWLGWWDQPRLKRISDLTIGLIGYGRIGRAIASIANGFGMRILAVKRDPSSHSVPEGSLGHCCDPKGELPETIYGIDDLGEVIDVSDIVVLALPLTKETYHIFSLREFESMKDSAFFVNVGRGGLVREDDLIIALEEGMISGAGLDVFETEPLPPESKLWKMENVQITPHSSVGGDWALDEVIDLFCENLKRFRNGEEMLNVVDKRRGY